MGKITGFLEIEREQNRKQPASDRVRHFDEFTIPMSQSRIIDQAARCMDCGVPFCQSEAGCPLGNLIPDWNDMVYRNEWERALALLHKTNNFPEFTGRICPAPCEGACVLGITEPAVAIKNIEQVISDKGFEAGWIKPHPPQKRIGKKIAIVGSGPAGLACAAQLNQAGHQVTVFEKADRVGGLLMYGIPNFKLDKKVVERRVNLLAEEGIIFKTNAHVGKNVTVDELRENFDSLVLCGGSEKSRDLPVEGRDLKGIHFAMDFLPKQTKRYLGDKIPDDVFISAKDKNVLIIGGGDTGSDCLGTSLRQGAKNVYQFEILPNPPQTRAANNPWPQWPLIMRMSSSHQEAPKEVRDYSVMTKRFSGKNGHVTKVHAVRITQGERDPRNGRPKMIEVPGSEFELDVELVLIAMGFVHPVHEGMVQQLGLELDGRGNVACDENKMTNIEGVFTAGDMTRGQSLVVWAIAEGREAARSVDKYLMGATSLPHSQFLK